jgi:hypothetical protein
MPVSPDRSPSSDGVDYDEARRARVCKRCVIVILIESGVVHFLSLGMVSFIFTTKRKQHQSLSR